jgi:hypothetical protein
MMSGLPLERKQAVAFLKKAPQKTFCSLRFQRRAKRSRKVFWLLFFKKVTPFLSCLPWSFAK